MDTFTLIVGIATIAAVFFAAWQILLMIKHRREDRRKKENASASVPEPRPAASSGTDITVGDIKNSDGVAIGPGARAIVNKGGTYIEHANDVEIERD